MREDELIYRDLEVLAPGTQLYEGLDSILKAKTGALIVIGDSPEVLTLVNSPSLFQHYFQSVLYRTNTVNRNGFVSLDITLGNNTAFKT